MYIQIVEKKRRLRKNIVIDSQSKSDKLRIKKYYDIYFIFYEKSHF